MNVVGLFKSIRSSIISLIRWCKREETKRILLILVFMLLVVAFIETLRRDLSLASAFVAVGTLILALVTAWTIQSNRDKENRDRKDSILNEIRDWIFEIKGISLEPITEDNIAFRQFNIELKYGNPLNRVVLLEMEIGRILKNKELKESVHELGDILVAVMVLDKAKHTELGIDKETFKSFPGYMKIIDELKRSIDEVASGKKTKDKVDNLWEEYINKLNDTENKILSKIVDIKAKLF